MENSIVWVCCNGENIEMIKIMGNVNNTNIGEKIINPLVYRVGAILRLDSTLSKLIII